MQALSKRIINMTEHNDRYCIDAKKESMLDILHTRTEMKLGRAMYYINRGCDPDDGCAAACDVFATTLVLAKPGLPATKIITDLRKTIDYIALHRINVKNFKY